jgi:hypothetical protein
VNWVEGMVERKEKVYVGRREASMGICRQRIETVVVVGGQAHTQLIGRSRKRCVFPKLEQPCGWCLGLSQAVLA